MTAALNWGKRMTFEELKLEALRLALQHSEHHSYAVEQAQNYVRFLLLERDAFQQPPDGIPHSNPESTSDQVVSSFLPADQSAPCPQPLQ